MRLTFTLDGSTLRQDDVALGGDDVEDLELVKVL